jgi:hypothetical protein
MTDTRGAAAEPASTRLPAPGATDAPVAEPKPRVSAAFASALAGAALIVGTVVTIVIVVTATSGG